VAPGAAPAEVAGAAPPGDLPMEEKAGKTTSEIIGNNPKPPKKQLPDIWSIFHHSPTS